MIQQVLPAHNPVAPDFTTQSIVNAQRAGQASIAPFIPSQAAMEAEIASVLEVQLADNLSPWIARYAQVGHRDTFLWKWCRRGVEVTRLSCVDPSLADAVCDTRVLGVMLDVLLDDVADYQKDLAFLEYLLGVIDGRPRNEGHALSAEQQAYATLTFDVWDEIQRRVSSFPRHQEFANLLRYDYRQLFNVMRYSQLISEYPEMLNLAEHDLYLPHNMHMMISSTMDLMCSPKFDRRELGILREGVWRAQCMGRVGNLVTTWQREIGENDFTSAVFSRAILAGDLDVDDLKSTNRDILEAVIQQGGHEQFFLDRWQILRTELLLLQPRCQSVQLDRLVAGLQRLICLHLGSRGKK